MNSENTLYNRWKHIRERCTNPKRKDYKWYGAKGIEMCEEWNSYAAFHSWFFEALLKYTKDNNTSVYSGDLVVDRIDSGRGYSPDNCRLTTVRENARLSIKNRDSKGRFATR